MDAARLRAEFPLFERLAYLNAGTDGPIPRRGADAATGRLRAEVEDGRSGRGHFDGMKELAQALRERLGSLIGADAGDIALTHSTTDGIATVLSALPLGRGDEVLTSDEEHPGLLVPLEYARRRKGFDVRFAPFEGLVEAVEERTKLVACSHVSWIGGRVADARAIAATGTRLLLDGAQGLGAVPVDVAELGCDFYAASGQKWLCGPDGSGSLYVRAAVAEQLEPPWPNYMSIAEPDRPAESVIQPGARRFDLGVTPMPTTAWSIAAFDVLAEAGWPAVLERAAAMAERLAGMLAERGVEVSARGRSTLVSWRSGDPEGEVARLAEERISVRHLPGRGLVRASVGAWSSDDDIERLVAAVAS
jgi:L-cysteine/cystine lyase